MLKRGVSVQSNSDGPGREKDNKICKQQNFTSEYNGGTPAVRFFFKKRKRQRYSNAGSIFKPLRSTHFQTTMDVLLFPACFRPAIPCD
jgi:hypothetical protein